MFQMMGVFAEFERAMIQERVRAGLARVNALGVPQSPPHSRNESVRLWRLLGGPVSASLPNSVPPHDPVIVKGVHLVLCDFGRSGRKLVDGQYNRPIWVPALNVEMRCQGARRGAAGWTRADRRDPRFHRGHSGPTNQQQLLPFWRRSRCRRRRAARRMESFDRTMASMTPPFSHLKHFDIAGVRTAFMLADVRRLVRRRWAS
jgi:hypothetical protein